MHWTEDGKIQVTRNFALGTARGVIVLALVMMLLIGMLISGNGDAEARAEVDPTPSVMAAERETIRPTTKPQNINREDATETLARPLAGTKTEYSTSLVRTQKSLLPDISTANLPTRQLAPTRSEYTVRSLEIATRYDFRVQATNESGDGPWSETKSKTTNTIPPNRSPHFLSGNDYSLSIPEKTGSGQNIGSPIVAQDPDNDPITYSLEGTDAGSFKVINGGQVQTQGELDHEGQSEYDLTIRASDGQLSDTELLTISVTDVQEAGSVNITPNQPIVGEELNAILHDPDRRTLPISWQWTSSPTAGGTFTDITDETSSSYTPTAADQGRHLRATASYTDMDPGQTAQAQVGPVSNPTLKSLTVSPGDVDSFSPTRFDYAVGLDPNVNQVTVTAVSNNPTATVTYSETDASNTQGHQLDLQYGINTLTITVTDEGTPREYQLTIGRGVDDDYGWKAQADLNTLIGADNLHPTGIRSDGTTMWVADRSDDKIYAYNTDGTRDSAEDFNTLFAAGNAHSFGIWSDGTTMWVADTATDKIYAYRMSDQSRDVGKDFDALDGANNNSPYGIWSDGTTMWVADRDDYKIYAYRMSDQTRDSAEDFRTLGAARNYAPNGIWSDGTTMWVADTATSKIYAYRMSDQSRDSGEDFGTLSAAGNDDPRGIWSDGTTMWVADWDDAKIYAYNMPISNDTGLRRIIIGDGSIESEDIQTEMVHHYQSPGRTVVIEATPRHPKATVDIEPEDRNTGIPGHQLEIGDDGSTLTITVTAQSGTIQTYTVEIKTPAGPPVIGSITPANGAVTVFWSAPVITGGYEPYSYNLRYIRSDSNDKTLDGNWNTEYVIRTHQDGLDNPLEYTLEDLENGVEYDVQVRAWTFVGYSPWSKTKIGSPSATQDPVFDEKTGPDLEVEENRPGGTDVGSPVTAVDPDQADVLTYTISGTNFTIDESTGQIRTKEKLDYEATSTYEVTVSVSDNIGPNETDDSAIDASLPVTIRVINVEESGTLEFAPDGADEPGNPHNTQPQATTEIAPEQLTDPDGNVGDIKWQWSKATAIHVHFDDIPNAIQRTFTPGESLIGYHLKVTTTYTDGHGAGKTAYAVTTRPTIPAPNAKPVFTETAPVREVDENTPAGEPVGLPITATDSDEHDVLTYTISGQNFTIDESTGQIRTKAELDYEDTPSYTPMVTVTDNFTTPAKNSITVTISVNDLNEPGTITTGTPSLNNPLTATLTDPDVPVSGITWQWAYRATGETQWTDINGATADSYTPTETDTGRYLRVTASYTDKHSSGQEAQNEIPFSVANNPPTFSKPGDNTRSIAENNEEAALVDAAIAASDPNGDPLTFSLTGNDAGTFTIDNSGQIRTAPGIRLDYEEKSSYGSITVQVSDQKNAAGEYDNTVDATLNITIEVTDANDPGVVTFSNPYPTRSVNLTTSLHDQDGPESGRTWQWASSPAATDAFTNISGATSASYTPVAADVGHHLRATVTYTDGISQDDTASGSTENTVGELLSFVSSGYTRHIFENPPEGWPLLPQEPIGIKNTGGDVTYGISGQENEKFTMMPDSGIMAYTRGRLDYENTSHKEFNLTVTATDESGAPKVETTVTVNIRNLIEDSEEETHDFGNGTVITWTRVQKTNFLIARDQNDTRHPEYEFNGQLPPCIQTHRDNWKQYDDYQLDIHIDETTVNYRDPDRSRKWTGYRIDPSNSESRGEDPGCSSQLTDVWNDSESLYALDTGLRLILAYELNELGTTYTRVPELDIPLSIEHYRTSWEIQGIRGDEDNIYVTHSYEKNNVVDSSIAAYDRATFLRDKDDDITWTHPNSNPDIPNRVHDILTQEDTYWITSNDRQTHITARDTNMAARTCPGTATPNEVKINEEPHLRVTGQHNLIYALNYNKQRVDTIDTLPCPAETTESEFDYQDIPDKPDTEPAGISTDDGLTMYFAFPAGEIRHISKILPELVETDRTITIPENTKGVLDSNTVRKAGKPFWVKEKQPIGNYSWYLENTASPADDGQETRCGEAPDTANTSDAAAFDCRSSGSRNQSFQLLTRIDQWFDYEEKDSYTLTLKVYDVDQDKDSVEITVNIEDVDETPASPDRPELSGEEQQAITVTWTAPTTLTHGAGINTTLDEITGYRVEYQPDGITGELVTLDIDSPTTTTTTLSDLHTNTRYNMRVLAVNGHGDGKWSSTVHTSTLVNPAPTLQPTDFAINENTPLDSDQVHITFLEAQDTDPQDSITNYEIIDNQRDSDAFEIEFHETAETDPTDPTTVLKPAGSADLHLLHLPNFEEQESYQFFLRVSSGVDRRLETTTFEITVSVTDIDEPPVQPEPPSTSHVLQRSFRASWTPPETTGPPINDYDVEFKKSTDTSWTPITHEGTALHTTADNLDRDTGYEIRVRAVNDEGESPWSEPAQTMTKANIPPVLPGSDNPVSRQVEENTPMGEPVGEPVTADDPDIDDEGTLTYTLLGTDAASFNIETASGQILVKETLDHESRDSHEVIVRVEDGQTGSDEVTVNIEVTDLIEKPEAPAAPTVTAGEYANTLKVEWTEPDNTGPPVSDYQVRYQKQEETGWNRWPEEVSTNTNDVIERLETNTGYDVQVRAYNNEDWSDWSDSGTGMTAANRSPVFTDGTNTERSIPETPGDTTETASRPVGAPVNATDADSGDTITYSLSGPDDEKFSIDSQTGQIHTNAGSRYDYETGTEYSVTVTAEDNQTTNQGVDTILVTIRLTDLNEAPKFDKDAYAHQVGEDQPPGQLPGIEVSATDPDEANDDGTQITGNIVEKIEYSISGAESAPFEINASTAALSLKSDPGLDHETDNAHEFDVTVTDLGGKTHTVPITITVLDVNEAPTFDNPGPHEFSINENVPVGTDVGDALTATDQDVGDILNYSISPTGTPFNIDQNGRIITKSPINYEILDTSYTLDIRVGDNDPTDPLNVQARVTISITDLDEDGIVTIRDNSPNPGDEINATLADEDTPVSDLSWQWQRGTQANVSDSVSETHRVTSLDIGQALRAIASYTDKFGDQKATSPATGLVPNADPVFSGQTYEGQIPENSTGSITVMGDAATATDDDTPYGDVITYSIEGTDHGFRINPESGVISTTAELDYEAAVNSFRITIEARDRHSGTDTANVTIQVLDVNEPPELTEPPFTREINENAPAGDPVGTKIPATDPDSANDDGATITGNIVESLTFEISGTGSELFTIDNDGQIRTRTKLDHESKESYTFQVRVTDKGTLSDEKQITINILDVNDPPEITNQPVGTDVDGRWKLDHPENLQAIYTYEADDPEGTATTWSLEGADASLFGIEGGALAFKTEPNFEAPADQDTDNQYLVDIKLSDGANTVMEKTTVRVTDVNESPAFGTDWYDESIDENTPGGSELGITLTATDPDSANDDPGVNIPGNIVEIVTYSIGGDDQATFSIESMTGELSLEIWPESGGSRASGYTWGQQA